MTAIVKTIEKSTPNRQSNEMFLRMILDCNCLDDEQLTILANISNTFFEQIQFRVELKKQNTREGPNVP